MTEIVTQLTIDARGAQKGTADFDRALRVGQAAVDRFLDRQRAAQAAMDKTGLVMTSGSQTISKLARDYEKLQAALNPTAAAIAKARRELEQTRVIADRAFSNLGKPLQEVNAVIDQATVKYGRLATAARAAAEAQAQASRDNAQARINASIGVARPSATSQGASYEMLDQIAAAQARQIAEAFTSDLNSRMIAGTTKSARDAAGVFSAELDRLDAIARQQGEQAGAEFARSLNERLVSGTSKSARDAASVFSTELDRLDTIAKLKAEQTGAEFGRALNASLIKGQGKSASESASVFVEQEKALQSLRVEFDQLAIAKERLAASEAQINKFAAAGLVTDNQRITMLDAANRRYEDTAVALARTQVPISKLKNGMGLARDELINLSRQAQDVFVSLASGQSPLTVLIQQGTQIADVFAASRGTVGGFFTQLLAWLGPLIPALGLAAAGVTAIYAAFSVASQRQDLANSLLGIGRAAGITGDQLNALAKESAAAGNVSVSAARSIAAEYTKTGKIAPAIIRDLIRVSKDYAATTGQEVPEAAKDLAASFADPIRGMETLNARLGTLGPSVQRAVRDAVNQNDAYRAQKILVDALVSSTERAANATSFWARTWDGLKRSVSDGVDAVGEAIGNRIDPSRQQQLNTVLSQRATIQERIKRLTDAGSTAAGTIGRLQANDGALANEEARIRRQIDLQQQAAKARQTEIESTNALNAAQARSKDFNADKERIDDLTKSVTDLRRGYEASTKALDEMVKAGPEAIQSDRFTEEAKRAAEYERNLSTATKQLEEFRTAQAAGSIEADRAAKALDIQAQFTGKLTAVQQGELAAQLKLNELRGSALSDEQRQAEAARARTAARLEGVRAEAEAAAAAKYGTDSLNAQTKAIQENGSEAGKLAEIRARAAKEAAETGGSAQVREQQLLAEELARVQNERVQNNAKLKEAADLERKLNAEVASGRMTLAQANQQLQVNQAAEENARRLRALGVNDNKAIAAANREVTEAVRARLSVEQQRAALGILESQQQTIQSLEREIALVGQSTAARRIELEVLQAKQQLLQQGISVDSAEGQRIVDRARRIGELNVQLDATRKAYEGIKQAQDFVADGFKSFVEDVLTGSDGIEGALKSLGKTFLSASLDAIISGKGPLAGITGLAANDNKSQGGLFGLLANMPKEVAKATAKGAEIGVTGGITNVAASGSGGASLFGINGTQLAGGLTAIASLAGAYGAGASAGSYGQAGIAGGLSGAMGGAALATSLGLSGAMSMALPGIGLVIGAGLALYGQQQARKQAKEQRRAEAEANYKEAAPQIATLGSQLRGDPQNTLRLQIAEAETAARKLGDVAFFAGRTAEQHKLYADFVTYQNRVIGEFRDGFAGFIEAMNVGLGPNSPFASAKANVKDFGVELLGFIDNAKLAFGDGSGQVEQARQATIAYALAVLDGQKSLSLVQTRLQEINGTAAGLSKVLADLGMSADAAASAIANGTTAALARLKASFETDLVRKTFDAQDKGYINEAADLIAELATLRTDAAALGTDQSFVTDYFKASAQAIVDGAQLTGDAFDDLLRRFPELNGNVRAFEEAIDAAARAAEIASRRLGYQDRLFAALNDTTTLEGQLAAYDRTASREREEEIKAGGEAIVELEMAQVAERYNIIRDFNKAANDNYKQSLQQAQDYIARFTRSIREYLDGLRAGSDSPLSPQARLAAAQSQYNAQLALAQGGNRDALDGITGYASDLLEAAKGFYASSAGFQTIFAQIESQLGALPGQISAEQFIVDAIEAGATATTTAIEAMKSTLNASLQTGSASAIAGALSVYFNALDANTDNLLSSAEYFAGLGPLATSAEQTAARSIFNSIDADGDGQLSRLELIRASTQENLAKTDYTNSLLAQGQQIEAQTQNILSSANTLQGSANNILNSQVTLLDAIRSLQDTSAQQLALLNSQLVTQTNVNVQDANISGNLVDNIKKVVFNTAMANQRVTVAGNSAALPFSYAQGGYVEGPGTATSDSISARLSNGEFVMRAAAVDRFGVGMLDRMNDNFAMPAMAVPMMVGGGGGSDTREMVAELKAMRAELSTLKRAIAAGAMHVREGVDEGTAVARETVRETKFKKRAAA